MFQKESKQHTFAVLAANPSNSLKGEEERYMIIFSTKCLDEQGRPHGLPWEHKRELIRSVQRNNQDFNSSKGAAPDTGATGGAAEKSLG